MQRTALAEHATAAAPRLGLCLPPQPVDVLFYLSQPGQLTEPVPGRLAARQRRHPAALPQHLPGKLGAGQGEPAQTAHQVAGENASLGSERRNNPVEFPPVGNAQFVLYPLNVDDSLDLAGVGFAYLSDRPAVGPGTLLLQIRNEGVQAPK